MSQSLRTLTNNKLSSFSGLSANETNLERGQIFLFTPGYEKGGSFTFCWNPPGPGTAIIEIWGASGSGAQMCCCGGGIPGNPGAYSRRTITVNSTSCFVCGNVGNSCGNSSTLCYRGRSEPTGVCWQGDGTAGCMCAEGGAGGVSFCSTSTSLYCCFAGNGFCRTAIGSFCGVICNFGSGAPAGCCAQAYGGNVNCFGGFSCASFRGCTPTEGICCFIYHVNTSPGIIGDNGAVITYNVDAEWGAANWSGQGFHSFSAALSAASRSPTTGVPFTACWAGARACGCYEQQGCNMFMPVGVPGMPAHPCSGVRDHAIRGGNGAVRISFF